MIMKKYILTLLVLAAFYGCQHDIARKVDYNITLSQENTYIAGDPVVFCLTGEVDNLLFYSGEAGSNYADKNRCELPMESVESLEISAEFTAKWGDPGHLEVWVTDDFDGLYASGDPLADSAAFAAIAADPAGAGWLKLDYDEEGRDILTREMYSLTDSSEIDITSDKLCLAFHWCAPDAVTFQRQYGLNGTLEYICAGQKFTKAYKDMGFKSISLNEDTPYDARTYNGSKFQNTQDFDVFFNGFDTIDKATGEVKVMNQTTGEKYKSPYKWNLWLVSTPFKAFPVDPDKGTVIKNVQNDLDTFEYTWKEPGTYTVTFVGTCANYLGSSSQVKEFTINIMEKL